MGEAGKMWLLPPAKGLCQVCATKHEDRLPHNAQSLYYQTAFQMEHGRGATWLDALEHCDVDMRQLWIDELTKRGVDVMGGGVHPVEAEG